MYKISQDTWKQAVPNIILTINEIFQSMFLLLEYKGDFKSIENSNLQENKLQR